MRRLLVIATAAVFFGFAALPAHAIGIQRATIEGPGINQPIVLPGPIYSTSDSPLALLEGHIGFDHLVFGYSGAVTSPVSDRPLLALDEIESATKYVITFYWANGSKLPFEVFPQVDGGPIVHAEQGFYLSPGEDRLGMYVVGGWLKADPMLLDFLGSVGVPLEQAHGRASPWLPLTAAVGAVTATAVLVRRLMVRGWIPPLTPDEASVSTALKR